MLLVKFHEGNQAWHFFVTLWKHTCFTHKYRSFFKNVPNRVSYECCYYRLNLFIFRFGSAWIAWIHTESNMDPRVAKGALLPSHPVDVLRARETTCNLPNGFQASGRLDMDAPVLRTPSERKRHLKLHVSLPAVWVSMVVPGMFEYIPVISYHFCFLTCWSFSAYIHPLHPFFLVHQQ